MRFEGNNNVEVDDIVGSIAVDSAVGTNITSILIYNSGVELTNNSLGRFYVDVKVKICCDFSSTTKQSRELELSDRSKDSQALNVSTPLFFPKICDSISKFHFMLLVSKRC